MKLFFKDKPPHPEKQLMKKCGYNQILDRHSGQISYVRVFGRNHYPRFHCYFDLKDDGFQINLHLDQKAPSYGKNTAHSGEYDGEVVEREGDRVKRCVESLLGVKKDGSDDKLSYNLMNFG